MSFFVKLEKMEREIEIEESTMSLDEIKDKYNFIDKELKDLEEKIEELLLNVYLDRIDEKQYYNLYHEFFDKLKENISRELYKTRELLSQIKTKLVEHDKLEILSNNYRKLGDMMRGATDNIIEEKNM